jgi:hypothetical protein
MGVSIKLYKTYYQLVIEKYKVEIGNVYTYNRATKLQISEIKLGPIIYVKYNVRGDHITSWSRTNSLRYFIQILEAPPISIFLGNEEIWKET